MNRLQITCQLLTVAMLLGGCLPAETKAEKPINFYYLHSEIGYRADQDILVPQVWDAADHFGDMRYILESYLQAPVPDGMVSPFPRGLSLVAVWSVGDCLYVKLNEQITTLSGLELTLACSCIAKTCFELSAHEQVRISSAGGSLDGADYITIHADSLLLNEIEMTLPEV